MKEYRVNMGSVGRISIIVKAKDEDEAYKKAIAEWDKISWNGFECDMGSGSDDTVEEL